MMKALLWLTFSLFSIPSFAINLTSSEYDPFSDKITYKPQINKDVHERHFQKSYDLEIRLEYYKPGAIFGIGNIHRGPLKTTIFAGRQFESGIKFKTEDRDSILDDKSLKGRIFYNMADGTIYIPEIGKEGKYEQMPVGVRYVPDKYKSPTNLERGHAIVIDLDLEIVKKMALSLIEKESSPSDREAQRKKIIDCFENDKKLYLKDLPEDQKGGYLYPRMVVGRPNNISLNCDGARLAFKIQLKDNDPECLP